LRVRAPNISRDLVVLVERHIHALVEFPIPAVKHHLEGNVGSILDTRDSRLASQDADAPRGARSFEIIDDELVGTGRGVEVAKGLGGRYGREQHSDSPLGVCAFPDYRPVRERESSPVRRLCVTTAKLGFVIFIEWPTHCREINDKMRIHDGHGRERDPQNGPSQLHTLGGI